MKNREIFRIFREQIDPVVSSMGFTALKNTSTDFPWTRELEDKRHEMIWGQIDKWPWDVWMGTQFTLNFQNSGTPSIGWTQGAKWARIGSLMKGKYKKEAEAIQNQAVAKIRIPTAAEYNKELGAVFAESDDAFVLDVYREKSQPVKFGRNIGDLWLRIVDAEDASAWARFLAAWLPTGLVCFNKLEGEQYQW